MNHLDLFSGIGGFSLAASWVWGKEHNIVSFVEIDPFCQKVLKKHWPDVPIISDIRDVKREKIYSYTTCYGLEKRWMAQKKQQGQSYRFRKTSGSRGTINGIETKPSPPIIDLLTGGFPCQPFSCAGKQRGERDDRFLWPEMLRVIQEIRPTWIIGENVAGIINLALDQVLSDLENEDYTCQPFIIPACAKDAPHRRDRVWIVAHIKGDRRNCEAQQKLDEKEGTGKQRCGLNNGSQDVADTEKQRPQRNGKPRNAINEENGRQEISCGNGNYGRTERGWLPEPNVGRVAHGIPSRVDRLKSLGNAIVPAVAQPILEAIRIIED